MVIPLAGKIPGGTELLNPKVILEKIGLTEKMKVADLGCGAKGYFVLQAAKMVGKDGLVYGVDILRSVLRNVEDLARSEGLENIKMVWSNLEIYGATKIEEESLDFAFLFDTLFQNKKRLEIMKEARRLIKKGGKLAVVEWKKTATPLGPPVEMRVDIEEVRNLANQLGLKEEMNFEAGPFHYGLVFVKE